MPTQKGMAASSGTRSGGEVFEQVRELLLLMAKTVSSIKIFTLNHEATRRMIYGLWVTMSRFLDQHLELELGIEEFSFTYNNRTVFKDEKAIKSLPFLFFRDGMKKLFFFKSLREDELIEFMGIVRSAFELPSEECDIVNLLWEKDLPNIRCFAPDAFLEAKIGGGKEVAMLRAKVKELYDGVVELAKEDIEEAEAFGLDINFGAAVEGAMEDFKSEESKVDGDAEEVYTSLSEQEDRLLREMLQANRKLSAMGEMVLLVSEILHLEKSPARFGETMEVAFRLNLDLIQKVDFFWASQLLMNIQELRASFPEASSTQRTAVEKFLRKSKDKDALSLIRKSVTDNKLELFQPFFEYLRLLGAESLSLVADLYGTVKNPSFLSSITTYLRDVGRQAPQLLLQFASPGRAALTKEIITIIGNHPDKRVIPLLGHFRGDWEKSIKLEAIKALGKFTDISASRVLSGYLDDPDEDIRVIAACNMRSLGDRSLVESVKSVVQNKAFDQKSLAERQAYLDMLGREKSWESYDLLGDLLHKKLGLFRRAEKLATKLCIVQTLERFPSPKAKELLSEGLRLKNRVLRSACEASLARMTLGDTKDRITPPEAI